MALVHNDNTAAVNTTALHIKNDAIAATKTVVIETTAAETNPLLELKNSNAATDKPVILSLNRSDTSAEADDMSIGTIRFDGVDAGNNATAYASIDVIASDVTAGDEGGKITFNAFAGGTAGTAASTNLLSIGGEDQANSTACEVVVNDTGIDCDFRIEGDSETHLIFAEAQNDRVSIGASVDSPAATLEITNASDGGVPLAQLNSNDTDKVALDINAANIDANVIDITADAVTTGNVISIGVDDCLTSGKIIAIDHNDAATDPGVAPKGISYDFDKDGTTGDGVSSGYTALEVNMADAATNHAGSTVTMKGLDIDVDSASNSGNNTNIGVDIKATDATNNYGIVIITDDDSATSADIVMKSDANNNDMAILAVGGEGALTIKTIDADTAAANLTLTIDGDIVATAAGGDIEMTTATATAAGSGVSNAASQSMFVEKKNGVIKTTILIDIAGLNSADTVGKVIGDGTDANAYLTKLTYAINGIVYEARIGCMETPNSAGTHTKNIDIRASTTNHAGAADGSGDPLWLDCGSVDWSIGAKRTPPPEDVIAALGSADDLYLYLSAGTTVSSATAAYNAGQFIIELWGAPAL